MPIAPDKIRMLDPVLAWLDRNAPQNPVGFNMAYVRQSNTHDYAKNHCGTVCCIAGAVAEFNDLDPHATLGEIEHQLGMTTVEGDALFLGMDQEGDILISFDDVTPAIAAKTIRNFITTGEVTWE